MKEDNNELNRRDVLKGLATVPVLGAFWGVAQTKKNKDSAGKEQIFKELNIEAAKPPVSGSMEGNPLRIGIIGFGIRGEQLLRAAGFATKEWKEEMKKNNLENPKDLRLKEFLEQEKLNIKLNGVCDVFDVRAESAIEAGSMDGNKPKRYLHFEEMMASPDIDAVIIATPDHWHAPMAMAAAKAGKHVYVEKCMTHKVGETYDLKKTIEDTKIVFQLGHQHRQTQSFLTAQDIIKKNVLGHVSLIQVATNRNDDNGAWQYEIHEKASPKTIDWQQFLGNAPKREFDAERFFRWRKWWDYGTGLSGDLLTHDYDRINTILKMGIPDSVMASGGVYTHIDGREVPDVFQVVMEFPNYTSGTSQEKGKEKGMTFLYTSTLGNQYDRGTLVMGHDATLELGAQLTVMADPRSTRYKEMIESGLVKTDVPMYSYNPSAKGVDAVSGATAKYFANKGMMYTYRDGKRVDSTFLHIKEWLSCIRHGGTPSCNIQQGFEEAISAHMATASLRLGKKIIWDHEKQRMANVSEAELRSVGMA
jgi:predicted dehydrogenase